MLLKKSELAPLLGISENTLAQYLKMGMTGRVGESSATRYDVAIAIEFHTMLKVRQAIEANKRQTPALDGIPAIEVSEQLIAHWKQERERAKTLTEAKVLIPIEVSTAEINHALAQIRGALDSIPGAWAPFMVGLTTIEQAQRILNTQLQDVFSVLEMLPTYETEIETSDDNAEDED